MKRELKGFTLGVIASTLIASTALASGATTKNIDALFNYVNLKINGIEVEADNIAYEGTTYVPIRAAAELLGKEVSWDQANKTARIDDKTNADESKITVDQIPFDIEIEEADSIGTVYMSATYKNNSDYIIKGISMSINLKDQNETTYLMTYDTVLPGETSPKFETFGPKSMKMDDIEKLKLDIVAEKNGKNILVKYDYKLNRYQYEESDI